MMSTTQAPISSELRKTLASLGITQNYMGYYQAAYAIGLALENENCLLNVSREIYQRIADLDGCKPSTVERNIRTVAHLAWEMNPKLLTEMAGYHLTEPPKPAEFIALVTNYLLRHAPEKL